MHEGEKLIVGALKFVLGFFLTLGIMHLMHFLFDLLEKWVDRKPGGYKNV